MTTSEKTPASIPSYAQEAIEHLPDLVALRRTLHQDPELGLDLPRTQERVLAALQDLGLRITTGASLSSIVAVLEGGRPGPVVLLRADMDALPLQERTGLPFASATGRMHACGHDLHTSALVGAARLLAAHREEIPGRIVFMFQPGEEGPGGAEPMIREGVLEAAGERPIAAYGIHVGPGPRGTFITRAGTVMAGAANLRVRVHGAGGHGSQPMRAIDPVAPLVEIAGSLQTRISRRFSSADPVVASVTTLEAGTAINVIPDSAALGATVRTMTAESADRFGELVRQFAENIARAHGARAEVDWQILYPATVNDDAEEAFAVAELREAFGPARVHESPQPLMGSEDFSYVLQEVPGCFVFLLCSPDDLPEGELAVNHSPEVFFDDSVLADQSAALASLAHGRLRKAVAGS
ncbi:M20 metallopeptidase family protein [Brachybacterium halotolerans]|uniref:M20 metallopeptidase family protein n=1 Tax=Brachybacterium halotolerans TaxID=2795215 RepID=UPI003899352A